MLRSHWTAGERRGRELEGKQMVGIDPVNSAKGDECVLLFRRLLCDVLMGAQSQAVPSSSAGVARPGRQVGRKSLRRFSVQEMAPIMTRRPDEARYVTSVVTLPPLECLGP